MADIKAYLAAKYMSGPKADAILARTEPTHKKKKRKLDKGAVVEGGIGVVDEDEFGGWANDAEDESSRTDRNHSAPPNQAGRKQTRPTQNPQPETLTHPPFQTPGTHRPSKRNAEASSPPRNYDSKPPPSKPIDSPTEASRAADDPEGSDAAALDPRQTVYRDKSGAIIDVAAAEASERRARDEERSAREERAKKEQMMGKKDVARYANDKDMNDELRAVERADDPAAAFLTKRKAKGPQRPKYTGPPAPPNRFNIPPGYRWDGVDRSTGFEAKLFQTMNNRKRRQVEANAWSMEDM
ncbi:hypothetical protein QFC20_001545 [Naganishia adeliensis]|uniref:Uncharacterized protein n=1 Tax=Naganishia adeliensis TaxID=92952 RepID=A0ACC2WTM3_9TREE|nr:hypothetical protein QFC20_001545 [Naganishia adeliensis]